MDDNNAGVRFCFRVWFTFKQKRKNELVDKFAWAIVCAAHTEKQAAEQTCCLILLRATHIPGIAETSLIE